MSDTKPEYATIPLPMMLSADENRNVALMFMEPPRLERRADTAPARRVAYGPLAVLVCGVTLVIAAVAQTLIA